MEFYSDEEAHAAMMRHGPTNPEVYAATTRYWARAYPAQIEIGGHLSPETVQAMADSLKGNNK